MLYMILRLKNLTQFIIDSYCVCKCLSCFFHKNYVLILKLKLIFRKHYEERESTSFHKSVSMILIIEFSDDIPTYDSTPRVNQH